MTIAYPRRQPPSWAEDKRLPEQKQILVTNYFGLGIGDEGLKTSP